MEKRSISLLHPQDGHLTIQTQTDWTDRPNLHPVHDAMVTEGMEAGENNCPLSCHYPFNATFFAVICW